MPGVERSEHLQIWPGHEVFRYPSNFKAGPLGKFQLRNPRGPGLSLLECASGRNLLQRARGCLPRVPKIPVSHFSPLRWTDFTCFGSGRSSYFDGLLWCTSRWGERWGIQFDGNTMKYLEVNHQAEQFLFRKLSFALRHESLHEECLVRDHGRWKATGDTNWIPVDVDPAICGFCSFCCLRAV